MCSGLQTKRIGQHRNHQRIYCHDCAKKISINHKRELSEDLLKEHLNRNSFRILAVENGLSPKTICRRSNKLAAVLIDSNDLTLLLQPQNYSGVVLVDGKYISVKEAKETLNGRRSKHKKGLVVISFVDYDTHDIPIHIVAASENRHDIEQGFQKLKELGYPLKVVVCDESMGEIITVARKVFPEVIVQLCLTHYGKALERNLQVQHARRSIAALEKKLAYLGESILIPTHKHDREQARQFCNQIADLEYEYAPLITVQQILQKIFWTAKTEEELSQLEDELNISIAGMDLKTYPHAQKIKDCYKNYYQKRDLIIAAIKYPELDIPRTTNLIEGYHSTSLEIRLSSLRGFEFEETAAHYINALILKRRFTKFTDCTGKFKHLNGQSPLQAAQPKQTLNFDFSDPHNWIHFCSKIKPEI